MTDPTNNPTPDPAPAGDPPEPAVTRATAAPAGDPPEPAPAGDTFDREYVERLRSENKQRRQDTTAATERAAKAERAVFRARVAADGRLADPDDLDMPDDLDVYDDAAITAAIDNLLAAKPHLKARKIAGDIGQGQHNKGNDSAVNLADMLRGRA